MIVPHQMPDQLIRPAYVKLYVKLALLFHLNITGGARRNPKIGVVW
jgi:hypothetical protein